MRKNQEKLGRNSCLNYLDLQKKMIYLSMDITKAIDDSKKILGK
jgi:hypothetical protein